MCGPKYTESYSLSVNRGGVWLNGGSVWGVLRGLETFYQLLYGNENDELLIKEVDIIGIIYYLSLVTIMLPNRFNH